MPSESKHFATEPARHPRLPDLTSSHWSEAKQIFGQIPSDEFAKIYRSRKDQPARLQTFNKQGKRIVSRNLHTPFPCSFVTGPDRETLALEHHQGNIQSKKEKYIAKSKNTTTVKLAFTEDAWSDYQELTPSSRRGNVPSQTGVYAYKSYHYAPNSEQKAEGTTRQREYGLAAKTVIGLEYTVPTRNNPEKKLKNIEILHYRGKSLLEYIHKTPLSFEDFLLIIFSCCWELYQFQAGNLHQFRSGSHVYRDIKPENFAIYYIESEVHIHLIDFETARQVDKSTGQVKGCTGTKQFIAPETWTEHYSTLNSDVFSMGLLIPDIPHRGNISGYLAVQYHPGSNGARTRPTHFIEEQKNIGIAKWLSIKEEQKSHEVELNNLVQRMTAEDPKKRPSISQVLHEFPQRFPEYFTLHSEEPLTITFTPTGQKFTDQPSAEKEKEERLQTIFQQCSTLIDWSKVTLTRSQLYDKLANNPTLANTVETALKYLEVSSQNPSRKHGVEKTVLFIQNLLTKNLGNQDSIQEEIERYLDAKGEYRRNIFPGFFGAGASRKHSLDTTTRYYLFAAAGLVKGVDPKVFVKQHAERTEKRELPNTPAFRTCGTIRFC